MFQPYQDKEIYSPFSNLNILIEHIENILRSFQIEPKPLDRIVDSYFKHHTNIGSKDRRFISNITFGIIRWKRRLEDILAYAKIKPTIKRVVAIYILWEHENSDHELLYNILGKQIDFDIDTAKLSDENAVFYSFPDFMYRIFEQVKGKDLASKLAVALNQEVDITIRTNTLKIDRNSLQRKLKDEGVETIPTTYAPDGLKLNKRINFNTLISFKEGLFEIQDEASQIAVYLVQPQSNETILDMCAGAGGKTLAIAALSNGIPKIIASDKEKLKLTVLKNRAKRASISNISIINADNIIPKLEGKCDVVLVDAPCSGSGTIRRNPDLKWRLNKDVINDRTNLQKALLEKATQLVKDNGRIVYITCSIFPQENEEIAAWFCQKFKWNLISAKNILKADICEKFCTSKGFFKTDPSETSLDGFFGAVFKKQL